MARQVLVAPKGYVYDWVEPHYDNDGVQIHLYANRLSLGRFDKIEHYQLIKDPRGEK